MALQILSNKCAGLVGYSPLAIGNRAGPRQNCTQQKTTVTKPTVKLCSQLKSSNSRLEPRAIPASSGLRASSLAGAPLSLPFMRRLEAPRNSGGALGAQCNVNIMGQSFSAGWIITIAALVLMTLDVPGQAKNFLAPLLTLQLPGEAFDWIRSENGLWVTFVALLVRLFFGFGGLPLELPLLVLLLAVTAPPRVVSYRGTQHAAIASLVAGIFIAYSVFKSHKDIKETFNMNALPKTLSAVVLILIPLFTLINGTSI